MSRVNAQSVTLGSAFVRQEGDVWHIGNDRISVIISWEWGTPLRLTRLTVGAEDHWPLDAGEALFCLETTGDVFAPLSGLQLTTSEAWVEGNTVRLKIDLSAHEGSIVSVHLECHDHQAILRQWLEVNPSSSLSVERVEPVRLAAPASRASTLHSVSGVQRQGGWRGEHGPYRSFRLESERLDTKVRRQSGIRSTWDETPWAALTGDDRVGGILLALEYGGRWELCAEMNRDASAIIAAFAPVGIAPVIHAGERWVSPSAWIGGFSGDLDSAAAVMHDYLRGTVLPPTDDVFPWVQYNTWFSYYCELDEETLLSEADIAAELGMEVFYVDAGWWAGNPRRKDRFSSGLGNWVENREKFPNGLHAFANNIRERGMHFGLWVEPERVDLRTASTGTWNPAWIARDETGHYVRCDWPSDTDTAWLCFGHPETQVWAEAWIGELVEDLGIRWLKWDSNYWGVCTSAHHGHEVGDAEVAQLQGVYKVMDRLRIRFPELVIENCAGGATRMDFEIARHAHVAWLNDASQPAHRSRFHNAGASYIFPPEMLNAWVTESEHENVNGQDLPVAVWQAIVRSRMIGAIGFSCQLVTWSDAVRSTTQEEIRRYKEELRPLLQGGRLHHLLPQPEIPSDRLPTPDQWEAFQLSSADGASHIVLAFRNVSPAATIPLTLVGIQANAHYLVTPEGSRSVRRSGHELLGTGLELTCPLLASAWVTIDRDGGAA